MSGRMVLLEPAQVRWHEIGAASAATNLHQLASSPLDGSHSRSPLFATRDMACLREGQVNDGGNATIHHLEIREQIRYHSKAEANDSELRWGTPCCPRQVQSHDMALVEFGSKYLLKIAVIAVALSIAQFVVSPRTNMHKRVHFVPTAALQSLGTCSCICGYVGSSYGTELAQSNALSSSRVPLFYSAAPLDRILEQNIKYQSRDEEEASFGCA
ncbi:hypothetical protein NUW58_g5412 [Xylaria curta]|uniref:Uncharacterized protein n=1 Tax=Xylaria curta TaxID=42375 RepID=A0ACC1P4P7_9PEZI|nr:hypothetical protein NUW58_g5412 [Xylaria curta]